MKEAAELLRALRAYCKASGGFLLDCGIDRELIVPVEWPTGTETIRVSTYALENSANVYRRKIEETHG